MAIANHTLLAEEMKTFNERGGRVVLDDLLGAIVSTAPTTSEPEACAIGLVDLAPFDH